VIDWENDPKAIEVKAKYWPTDKLYPRTEIEEKVPTLVTINAEGKACMDVRYWKYCLSCRSALQAIARLDHEELGPAYFDRLKEILEKML
jgi:hypothetical protein